MTDEAKKMFRRHRRGGHDELVFVDKKGRQYKEIPSTFKNAIKGLKLNDGISDRRDKVVFHTLRHTYASWHVENGTDIYILKELLGHSTLVMTERYSHVSPGKLQDAVNNFEKGLGMKQTEPEDILENSKEKNCDRRKYC